MIVQKRIPKRTPAFVKGSLEGETSVQDVYVRDISDFGALLDVSRPLRQLETVTLVCGNSRINGIVAWSDETRMGVEFSDVVTGDTLKQYFGKQLKVSAPKSYRPQSE